MTNEDIDLLIARLSFYTIENNAGIKAPFELTDKCHTAFLEWRAEREEREIK